MLPEELHDRLVELFGEIETEKFVKVPVGPLDPADLAELEQMKKECDQVANTAKMLQARIQLFWAKMEAKVGIFDRPLSVHDGVLYVEELTKEKL